MRMQRSKRKSLIDLVKEYADNTTLHGPKYIGENQTLARLFWIIIVISAASFGVFLVARIIHMWQSYPIITAIESTNYPVSNIPFPAVTICPNVKGLKEKLMYEICHDEELINIFPNGSETYLPSKLAYTMAGITNLDFFQWNDANLALYLESSLGWDINKTVSVLKRISPTCDEYILKCFWKGDLVDCTNVRTSFGNFSWLF